MKRSKKCFLLIASALVLVGCQSQSNQLTFNTPTPSAMFNTQNQTAQVNVITQDLRPSTEIANYTDNGQSHRLNAVPEVRQMFQQVMQQNLNSKGFTVVQGAGNANVLVNVNRFFADVEQGNLRYQVNAAVGVEVVVSGSRGEYKKHFNATRGYQGAFGASNDEIQKVLGQAYADVVQAIYNDNEVGNAIHQYK